MDILNNHWQLPFWLSVLVIWIILDTPMQITSNEMDIEVYLPHLIQLSRLILPIQGVAIDWATR